MKRFLFYLKSKAKPIVFFAVCALFFALSFRLYHLPMAAILYPLAVCAVFGAAFLTADWLTVRARAAELDGYAAQAAETGDEIPSARTPCEDGYRRLALALRERMNVSQAAADVRYRDAVDYYTVWAHQIKTPLASMKLTLESEDSELSRRLSADLLRTGQYVDMALAFLRLDSSSTDYVFAPCAADTVIRACLRKFAPEFIVRKLSLTYEPTGATVVTDEKWLAFLIEQILSNALKYTRAGGITIAFSDGVLTVSDTGIGIAPSDLPRLFEKGFTGFNGREDKAATGLGLYLCRRVADALGITLSVTSEIGVGTTVSLAFPADGGRHE